MSSVSGRARSIESSKPKRKLYRTDLQGEITITTRGKDDDMALRQRKKRPKICGPAGPRRRTIHPAPVSLRTAISVHHRDLRRQAKVSRRLHG